MPTAPSAPGTTPRGKGEATGKSHSRGTSPSKMAAETALAAAMLPMVRWFRAAQSSTENFPFTSVAVVTTGVAPSSRASSRVSSFAPPMWPESREMTNCPASSVTSTAGSVFLSFTQGAMALTAMPVLPTNRMASAQENTGPTNSARGGIYPSKSGWQNFSGANIRHCSGFSTLAPSRAVSQPRRVKANTASFIGSPPGGRAAHSWGHRGRIWNNHPPCSPPR